MIYLLQVLCPQRHCIFALPGTLAGKEATFALAQTIMDAQLFNPWCGICGSLELAFDWQPTQFKTLEEAEPYLKQLQEENLATRQVLDAAGMTFDVRRKGGMA